MPGRFCPLSDIFCRSSCRWAEVRTRMSAVKSSFTLDLHHAGSQHSLPLDALPFLACHDTLLHHLCLVDYEFPGTLQHCWASWVEVARQSPAPAAVSLDVSYRGRSLCVLQVPACFFLHARICMRTLEPKAAAAGVSASAFQLLLEECFGCVAAFSLQAVARMPLPASICPQLCSQNRAAQEPAFYPSDFVLPLDMLPRHHATKLCWCPFCPFSVDDPAALQAHVVQHFPPDVADAETCVRDATLAAAAQAWPRAVPPWLQAACMQRSAWPNCVSALLPLQSPPAAAISPPVLCSRFPPASACVSPTPT